jgi:pristinamycin I synthase-3/4
LPSPTEWKNLNLEQLEAMLAEKPNGLQLTGIPDLRLAVPLAFRRALDSADAGSPVPELTTIPSNAVSAEDLFAVAAQAGYRAHVRWADNGTSGLLHAVFFPISETALPAWPQPPSSLPANALANTPRSAKSQILDLTTELRRHLARQLPEYMVPAAFVTLLAFPLTPNGKIDRKALPSPSDTPGGDAPREITAPRSDTETKLLDIWKQVLGRDDIGVDDDIFELGGDSILIFQITTRATRAGIDLTPARVFRLRTIAALVAGPAAESEKTQQSTIQRVNRDAYRRNL